MSTSTIKYQGDRVVKTINRSRGCAGLFTREVVALGILRRYHWSPDLLELDVESLQITMTYLGPVVAAETLPEDWRDQMDEILDDLAQEGLRHNDIRSQNILVRDGKLRLIDFGWATTYNQVIPNDWPNGVLKPALKNKRKNDRLAFEKAIRRVIEGGTR